ncbi:MAG: N-6 DNA methylase [Synergistaceae bacterium]|nr:N-6 DNA methylase [Synergistaceae bacterium]
MAADLTGILSENEFFTGHYLAALIEGDMRGSIAEWKKREAETGWKTPWTRLASLSGGFFDLRNRISRMREERERAEAQRRFLEAFLSALGYATGLAIRELDDKTTVPVLAEVVRPSGEPLLWCIDVCTGEDRDVDILSASLSAEQFPESEKETPPFHSRLSFEELVSRHIFARNEPPRWLILAGGSQAVLLDREKWREKRALRFHLDEIFSRKETSTLQALSVLLHRESLCPPEGDALLDRMEAESRRHASNVSDDLRYALREAVEILGNEAVHDIRTRRKVALFGEGDLDAAQLSLECLRYLYRLLFLFYVESRPELGYAPMPSEAYRTAYSLESLREMENTPLDSEEACNGAYFDTSLRRLFGIVFGGYPKNAGAESGFLNLDDETPGQGETFRMKPLPSHLFDPERTPLLDKVRFRNGPLQKVIRLLSLSRPGNGRSAGRVSYARLGIGQLGAVYEGLLSYTGFFAREDLFEVRKEGVKADELDVAYFVPRSRLGEYAEGERAKDGEGNLKCFPKGTFIYRLAGRERQKSASYYTPESLVKCLVKYALKELLEGKKADELLETTVCEPAMGSAAFLNEAADQLADAYLQRKQRETGKEIPLDEYTYEKQRVKMYLAAKGVFGVDLNPVAVELAEVSLWLGAIHRDAPVPWFGMQLVCGNSLVGARRAVYDSELLRSAVRGAPSWKDGPPETLKSCKRRKGTVYHFLLPSESMAEYGDKTVKSLLPDEVKRVKEWRKHFCKPFTEGEINRLESLSEAVDGLWSACAEEQARLREEMADSLPVFGRPAHRKAAATSRHKDLRYAQEILSRRVRASSPYRRLKLAMDYWCALWFWPLEKADMLPSREEWLFDMELLLHGGVIDSVRTGESQLPLFPSTAKEEAEQLVLRFGMVNVETLLSGNGRLKTADDLARKYRFLHWEIEFADIFAFRGGFDLVLGNPPWIKVEWTEGDVLGDSSPLFVFRNYSATRMTRLREELLRDEALRRRYVDAYEEAAGQQNFLNARCNYPELHGMQSNLYKCFLPVAWRIGSERGVSAFLHPEGVYDDPKGGALRRKIYSRLRYHFQFQNELKLFSDIHDETTFSLNVYGTKREYADFFHIANLFAPATIDASFPSAGGGTLPGIKTDDNRWNTAGHRERVVRVTGGELALFSALYDQTGTPPEEARLPALHGQPLVEVLQRFARTPKRLGDLEGEYFTTVMFDETNRQNDGTIRRETRFPDAPEEWVLSGPHFFVGNPFNKTPRRVCTGNSHYDVLDLTELPEDYLPRTNYTPACTQEEYVRRTPSAPWDGRRVTEFYRYVNREMIGPSAERTLIPSIIPPKAAYINTCFGVVFKKIQDMLVFYSGTLSIAFDFLAKITGKGHANVSLVTALPLLENEATRKHLFIRSLGLTCLTKHYAPLWSECWDEAFRKDSWTSQDPRLGQDFFRKLAPEWRRECALRTDLSRRQALVEIDVLAAMALGLTLDQLLSIYRVQFPVLRQNEADTWYDAHGRIVFTAGKGLPGVGFPRSEFEAIKGMGEGTVAREIVDDTMPGGPRTRTIEYRAPFSKCDREEDYRRAWDAFSRREDTQGTGLLDGIRGLFGRSRQS